MLQSLPLFVRKFAVDAIETAIGLIFALNIAFPGSIEDAKRALIVFGGAILSALISAARRAAPDFIAYVKAAFGNPA